MYRYNVTKLTPKHQLIAEGLTYMEAKMLVRSLRLRGDDNTYCFFKVEPPKPLKTYLLIEEIEGGTDWEYIGGHDRRVGYYSCTELEKIPIQDDHAKTIRKMFEYIDDHNIHFRLVRE